MNTFLECYMMEFPYLWHKFVRTELDTMVYLFDVSNLFISEDSLAYSQRLTDQGPSQTD